MAGIIFTTAGTLLAVLAFTDPNNTTKIAYDRDDLAQPLIDKLRNAIGDKDGSQEVHLSFGNSDEETELEYQFSHICRNIGDIFNSLHRITSYK